MAISIETALDFTRGKIINLPDPTTAGDAVNKQYVDVVSSGSFTYTQSIPAASATIVHNLGRFPNVVTVTLSGDTIEGDIHYIDPNSLTVTFSAPFSWIAYLE